MRGDDWTVRLVTASDNAPSASDAGIALNGATVLWWRFLISANITSYNLALYLYSAQGMTRGWYRVPSAVTPLLTYSAVDFFQLAANSGLFVPAERAFARVENIVTGGDPSGVVSLLAR